MALSQGLSPPGSSFGPLRLLVVQPTPSFLHTLDWTRLLPGSRNDGPSACRWSCWTTLEAGAGESPLCVGRFPPLLWHAGEPLHMPDRLSMTTPRP